MKINCVEGPSVAVFADATDQSMLITDLARAVEERGFTGIFLNEHTHQPIATVQNPFHDGVIPERYARFWDPYVALSFVAALTDLQVGPFVSLIGEHDPIALAKAVATLDVLSGGRLILGVGYGWHREEFEDHGFPARRRAFVVGEKLELMKRLWTQEVASYKGEFVSLSPSRAWPKPLQQPYPPVLMGVPANPRNFERIANWADGWIPMARSPIFEDIFAAELDELRRIWTDAGRAGLPSITVNLYEYPTENLPRAFERCAALGVERILVHVPDGGRDACLRRLDGAASVLGQFAASSDQ